MTVMMMIVAVIYVIMFTISLLVFCFVAFYKKRRDLFLFLTPICCMLLSVAQFFNQLGSFMRRIDPETTVWFAKEKATLWLSVVNNSNFMLYNWLFSIQYFRSSLIFPKLIVNS